MPMKKLPERLTFSCNQKVWQVSREKNISIWPLQFRNAIGSKSLGICMYIFTKRKYVVNWRCTCEVWENKVLHDRIYDPIVTWLKLNKNASNYQPIQRKRRNFLFLLNSIVNCEKNDNKHSLIRTVKNEFLDKFQAKRLVLTQDCRSWGVMAPLDFFSISTRGEADYHPTSLLPPPDFQPSYGPALLT